MAVLDDFGAVRAASIARYGVRAALFATIGLSFLATSTCQTYISDPLVRGLAWLSEWIIRMGHGPVDRHGGMLTNPVTGATVYVTQACDGLGVAVIFLAMLIAARPNLRLLVRTSAQVLILAQCLNVLRMVALFELRSGPGAVYDATHLYFMPYMTVLVGFLISTGTIAAGLNRAGERATAVR